MNINELCKRFDELSVKGIWNLTHEEHLEIRKISKEIEEFDKMGKLESNGEFEAHCANMMNTGGFSDE